VSLRRGTAIEPSLGSVTILVRAPSRFTITGELDLATAPRVDELEDVHGPLLLDLRGVKFMDASGITALVRLSKRCPHRDCTFQIEACSPPVERLLRVVNLYGTFTNDGVRRRTEATDLRWVFGPRFPRWSRESR
jgi:anti-anti-sigma factor